MFPRLIPGSARRKRAFPPAAIFAPPKDFAEYLFRPDADLKAHMRKVRESTKNSTATYMRLVGDLAAGDSSAAFIQHARQSGEATQPLAWAAWRALREVGKSDAHKSQQMRKG